MSLEQGKLFPQAERLKLQRARVKHIKRSCFDRLWREGWDPGYILEVEPDDIPTLAEVWRKTDGLPDVVPGTPPTKPSPKFRVQRLWAVVLSKGPEDRNRRIVAEDNAGWVKGLWISLLQRQVRDGTQTARGRCYAILTRLECDEDWQFIVDRWTQDLLVKRRF